MQITFTMDFDENGEVVIRLPEGSQQKVNAAKTADLTDKISKALGEVKERHIGDHTHGVGEHDHDHDQEKI